MNRGKLSELSRSLIKVGWFLGPKGVDGGWCRDITSTELLALENISDSCTCTVSSVGLSMNFTRSGATRLVNRLVKKGFIGKMRSDGDGRVCCISLTDDGLAILNEADKRYFRQIEQLLAKMPPDLAKSSAETLIQMARYIDDQA